MTYEVLDDAGDVVDRVVASGEFMAANYPSGRYRTAPGAGIGDKKAQMIDQINAKRDELETQGFPHVGLRFDSDERSVARINSTALTASAALIAGAAHEFPDWIAADNTPLPVDAQGVLSLQASLTRHGGELHAHARALKARVLAAQTADDLAAIDITAGWPV